MLRGTLPDRQAASGYRSASSSCAQRKAALISLGAYELADVDPRVLVDLPAEEPAPVRALVERISARSRYAGSLIEQGASLAAVHVLRLVEAQSGEAPETAERAAVVATRGFRGRRPRRAPCRPLRDARELVHRAADPRVVHRDDRLGPRSDRGREPSSRRCSGCPGGCRRRPAFRRGATTAFAVETNVKDGMTTSSPGPDVEEHRRHLERCRARVREQDLVAPDALLEPIGCTGP